MSKDLLIQNLRTPELAIGLAGLVILLLLNFVILESPARHHRIWQESRLLGDLSQRQALFAEAANLNSLAVTESTHFGKNSLQRIISLTDRGILQFRQGNYPDAATDLQEANEAVEHASTSSPVEQRLLKSESIRLKLQLARTYHLLGNDEDAKLTYLDVMRVFSRPLPGESDEANESRLKQAFDGYWNLPNVTEDPDAVPHFLSAIDWKQVGSALDPASAAELDARLKRGRTK